MSRTKDNRKRLRSLVFAAIACALAIGVIETAARFYEKSHPSRDESVLTFQKISDEFLQIQRTQNGETTYRTVFFPLQQTHSGETIYRTVGATHTFQAVASSKKSGEARIGVIGESAVAGLGISPNYCFTSHMQKRLRDKGINARVVNLGQIGYSSRQLRVMADEALGKLSLDALFIFIGNNEYLESNALLAASELRTGASGAVRDLLSRTASVRIFRVFVRQRRGEGRIEPASADAPLPNSVRKRVQKSYEQNLESIVGECRRRGVRPILVLAPVNLRYTPLRHEIDLFDPYPDDLSNLIDRYRLALRLKDRDRAAEALDAMLQKSAPEQKRLVSALKAGLFPDAETSRQFWRETHDYFAAQTPTQLTHPEILLFAESCAKLNRPEDFAPFRDTVLKNTDPEGFYGLYFRARFAEIFGGAEEAVELFRRARDKDYRRIRTDSDELRVIRAVAERTGTELFDGEAALAGLSAARTPGYDLFLDYCHLNVFGHLALGSAMADFYLGKKSPDAEISSRVERLRQKLRSRTEDGLALSGWIGYDNRPAILVAEDPKPVGPPAAEPTSAQQQIWNGFRLAVSYAGQNEIEYGKILDAFQGADAATVEEIECLLEGQKCNGPGFLLPGPS